MKRRKVALVSILAAGVLVVGAVPAWAGHYLDLRSVTDCVGYVQRDGSNNRAYHYDVFSTCDYSQIMHQYQINGGGPWVWTPLSGTAGNIVYSQTTINYNPGSECGVASDGVYSKHSLVCPF